MDPARCPMSDTPAVEGGRRKGGTIPIVSPFQTKDVRKSPRWWERLRGLFGMTFLVVIAGITLAVVIAFTLVAAAIFVATAFN